MARKTLLTILLISATAACLVPGCSKSKPVAVDNSVLGDEVITSVNNQAGKADLTLKIYMAYDNTVTKDEARNLLLKAQNLIMTKFGIRSGALYCYSTPKWDTPSSPANSVDMITDLETDYAGYARTYNTCMGISRKPTTGNDNPGLHVDDYCFVDFKPNYSTYDSYVMNIMMHEWGHSLGASQCYAANCVMSTYGWSHGRTAFCPTCTAKIKSHMGW